MRIRLTTTLIVILLIALGRTVLGEEGDQRTWRHMQDANVIVKREIPRIRRHTEGIDIQKLDHDEDKQGMLRSVRQRGNTADSM